MALSFSQVGRRTVFGDRRVHFYDVTFDDAYPTGGEAVTPGNFGMNRIDFIQGGMAQTADGALGLYVNFDASDNTLKVYEANDNAPFDEIGADDIALYTCRIMVVGV